MVREIEDEDVEFDEEGDLEDLDETIENGTGPSGLAGFVVGLLIGGVIGAGVMLFSAPDRGTVTRRRVRRRIEDFGEDASNELARHRRRLRKRLTSRRR